MGEPFYWKKWKRLNKKIDFKGGLHERRGKGIEEQVVFQGLVVKSFNLLYVYIDTLFVTMFNYKNCFNLILRLICKVIIKNCDFLKVYSGKYLIVC